MCSSDLTGFGNLLKSNDNFNSSLNQIKVNLYTAFAPIYNYILPAIQTLMNYISKLTGTIATFVASIFGKSVNQAKESANALHNQARAYKEVGKASEEAAGQLGSFDDLEVMDQDSKNTGSSGGLPNENSLDFSNDIEIDSKILDFFNKIKEMISTIDFTNLNIALEQLSLALIPFAENVGQGLMWFLENVILPLSTWVIEDVIPAFLYILKGAIDIVNKAITDLKPIFEWFWEKVVIPIANWAGEAFVNMLNGLGDALQWITNNEYAMAVIEGIAIAIGICTGAVKLWTVAATLAKVATALLGGTVGFLKNSFTIAVLAIGLLIAAGILLYKNWDTIKEKVLNVGNKIKEIWEDVKTTTARIFTSISNSCIAMLNKMIDGVNKFSNVALSPINTVIKGLNTPLEALGLSKIPTISIKIASIPKLATGAVIPPNKEFMAILGDQKSGTNIETPLKTMIEAFNSALDNRNHDRPQTINLTTYIQLGDGTLKKVVLRGIRAVEDELGKPLLLN